MVAGRLKVWNDLAGEWEYTPGGDGGGSQPYKRTAAVTINWDDADLYADGINVGTIPAGATFAAFILQPVIAFNGDNSPTFTYNTKAGSLLDISPPDFFGSATVSAEGVADIGRIADIGSLMVNAVDVIAWLDDSGTPITQGQQLVWVEYLEAL